MSAEKAYLSAEVVKASERAEHQSLHFLATGQWIGSESLDCCIAVLQAQLDAMRLQFDQLQD